MNWLNPIKELYDLYSEEEIPRILKVVKDILSFDLDIKDMLVDLYLKL